MPTSLANFIDSHKNGRCQKVTSWGPRKIKRALIFFERCNADNSEKTPLIIIGLALHPRAFKKKSGQELGFDYYANKKTRMNTPLFFAWVICIGTYINLQVGRKVLLMIDKRFAHGTEKNLSPLRNFRFQYLPLNTTNKLKLLDAGIIAWVKAKYKNSLLF